MKKIGLILSISFIVLTACAIAVSPTQAASPWKVYQNDQYGFTFEYPAAYANQPDGKCAVSAQVDENSEATVTVGLRSELTIFADARSAEAYIDQVIADKQNEKDWSLSSKTPVTVGGIQAYTIEYRFGGMNRYGTATALKQGDNIFLFNVTAGGMCDLPDDGITEMDAYQHIIQTFQFIQ